MIESGNSTSLALGHLMEPFREAFERAAVGMALVDLEGRPLETNPALREMLGYGSGEIRGMIFTEFTHPEDASKDLDLYKELVTGEREYYQIEKRYLKKGGEQMWGRLTVSLVREESGHDGDGSPGQPLFAVWAGRGHNRAQKSRKSGCGCGSGRSRPPTMASSSPTRSRRTTR